MLPRETPGKVAPVVSIDLIALLVKQISGNNLDILIEGHSCSAGTFIPLGNTLSNLPEPSFACVMLTPGCRAAAEEEWEAHGAVEQGLH